MLIYISGFGSTFKSYIQRSLEDMYDGEVHYYVLTNHYSIDAKNLADVCEKYDQPIHVIGHSTGAFHALNLFLKYEIESIHCINPAWNLLFSLDRNTDAEQMLVERNLIQMDYDYIMSNLDKKKFITLHQGTLDDRVDIDFNYDLVKKMKGKIYLYNIGHRFDESEFKMILTDIKKYTVKNYGG